MYVQGNAFDGGLAFCNGTATKLAVTRAKILVNFKIRLILDESNPYARQA